MLRDRVRGFVNLAAVVVWLLFTLHYFDLEQPILHGLRDILNASLDIGNVSISLGDIIAFVAAVWLATLASRFTRFVLEEDVFPRLYLPRGVPGAISKISHYIIVGLGILIAFTAAGIDISNLTLVVGALGVGIGFGLQNIVNNFVSGLVLIFERPVKVGDTIEVEPLIGTVRHIGIRASTVRTFEGAEVIVPNGDLISGRVVNWTLSDQQRRVDVNAGVAYGSDPNRVIEILLEAASQHPKVLKHPEPFVLFKGFGESSLDFTLRFWTPEFAEWLNVQSDVTLAVHDGLYAAEIEIPFPQRDLHLRSVDASISGEAVSEALTQRDESSGRIASGSPPPEAPSIRADTEDTDK
jgi:potassium efflux system protein